MFNIVHQELRDYVLALPDFGGVVEPMPNASAQINYSYLYEELVSFV
jgi:hypothetical protein